MQQSHGLFATAKLLVLNACYKLARWAHSNRVFCLCVRLRRQITCWVRTPSVFTTCRRAGCTCMNFLFIISTDIGHRPVPLIAVTSRSPPYPRFHRPRLIRRWIPPEIKLTRHKHTVWCSVYAIRSFLPQKSNFLKKFTLREYVLCVDIYAKTRTM